MVEEHTRPSFQPTIQEIAIAAMMVVISWRMAPRTAPEMPARSVVDLESVEVRGPGAWWGESKYEGGCRRIERNVWVRAR